MGIIQNLIKGMGKDKAEFRAKYKEAEQEQKINEIIRNRKLSSNQREYEAYLKRQNEEMIKRELDKIHKKQNQDSWKSNMFNGDSMLKNDRSILKEKNIFIDNKNRREANLFFS